MMPEVGDVPLRIGLACGLISHKVVWELMKRGARSPVRSARRTTAAGWVRIVKLGKVGVLAFLVVQTLLLDLFPISEDPTGLRATGVLVFIVGLATAVIGRIQLGHNWVDLEDYQVLRDQQVVARGLYRYVRHPIYTGDLLLLVGLQLALNSWLVLLVLAPALVVVRQAHAEEALLSATLDGYDAYCRRTKRFIPFIV